MGKSTTPKPLRITVTLDMEVSAADWSLAFGVEGKDAITTDVKEYVLNLVQQAGVFGNGEVESTTRLRQPRPKR